MIPKAVLLGLLIHAATQEGNFLESMNIKNAHTFLLINISSKNSLQIYVCKDTNICVGETQNECTSRHIFL